MPMNALQLSGVKMGSGMTGKLGLAWVDAWVGVWVHGWWVGGGDLVMVCWGGGYPRPCQWDDSYDEVI